MSKFKTLLHKLDYIDDAKEESEMVNLLKTPKKDIRKEVPHTTVEEPDYINQIDLLYLPHDHTSIDKKRENKELKQVNEYRKETMKKDYKPLKKPYYKYLLVCVDLATGKIDAEPLQHKFSFIVRDALIRLYKRKILHLPHELEVDAGSEFRDWFDKYFRAKTNIRRKESGRHRAQAVVESVNAIISKIIQTRQLGQELNTNEKSVEWVEDIPKIVEEYNKLYIHKPPDTDVMTDIPIRVKPNSSASNLIEEGTMVRVQLDNPVDTTDNRRLHGKFRVGDIRWSREVRPVTQIYLRPDQPPMYKVGDNGNVAYTKNQLQIVKDNEVKPSNKVQKKFEVEKIIEKFKKKNKWYYKVLWSDGDITEQLKSAFTNEVPDIVKDFESNLKKQKK
jgi:hypothetical protein